MLNRPATTATAVRSVPRSTETGECWSTVVVAPLPNCPSPSEPQHLREPLSRMAQVCCQPAETAIAVRSVPRSTETGECWSAVVVAPLPNCPLESPPQHLREPSSRMAQEWSPPMSMDTAVRSVPRSTDVDGGDELCVTPAPLPSSP